MKNDADEDMCNCYDCYCQPNLSFRIKEVKRESAKPELPGMKRGFFLSKNTDDEGIASKRSPEVSLDGIDGCKRAVLPKENTSSKHKIISMPETIECVVVHSEVHHEEEKIEVKCTKCIEQSDLIDILNQGAFKVTCTDGCILTLHRNCFEKTLGSGKKKELKSCTCPVNNCNGSIVIEHRIPGRDTNYNLWLRCDVRESDKPKKEEKGKDVRKKDKDKDKLKKDRCDEDNGKIVMERTCASDHLPISNYDVEDEPIISIDVNIKSKEEEVKKNLVRPLPVNLQARPIERKEDALVNKYAVKEINTKEIRKKNKKEVRQVILPGLTVRGQRGKKEEEDDEWNRNDTCSPMEDDDVYGGNGIDNGMDNNDITYEDSPFGFMMPAEIESEVPLGERDWIRRNVPMTPTDEMNALHSPFHHSYPTRNEHRGIFTPTHMKEVAGGVHSSSVPIHDTGRGSISELTESPATDEPPLIENPFDYPSLEKECVRKRKELVNFFERHTRILEENASLFDSPQIDLDQLICMLEYFIEFQFVGNDDDKKEMINTLGSIFGGDVENDIIPLLMDLQCFKCGYVDGRLIVSVKNEGRMRREREDGIRREREYEDRRRKDEEEEWKENERRREEKKKEEVRRAVMELEERQKRLDEERRMDIERREEEERRARDKRRKEEEEKRQIQMEERRMEEEKRREGRKKKEMEEEERNRMENEKKKLEEKKKKEEEERERRIMEIMEEEEEESRKNEATNNKKINAKKTKERELERKTREAINTLGNVNQTKGYSRDSSPERKKELLKCTPSIQSLHSSTSSLVPSSSSFSTSALPFVPRPISTKVAELNPFASAFVPTHPSVEVPTLFDEKGTVVDSKWLEEKDEIIEEKDKTIVELNGRITELEDAKKKMEECLREKEIDMSKKEGERINENKKNIDKIFRLENEMRENKNELLWKEQTISEMTMESVKKLEELRQLENKLRCEREMMNSEVREVNKAVIRERREKEIVMDMKEMDDEEKRRKKLERMTDCAMESIISCTQIINSLTSDPQAQVMTSIFIDVRHKWIEHHSILNTSLNTMRIGIDWDMIFSLEIPQLPRETDELVTECYVWHYQTLHNLSYRLAFYVRKYLRDHQRNYEDALIVGIIQKWMRTHKDLSKIDAKVHQVANLVAIAIGDTPLFAPQFAYVTPPPPPISVSNRMPSSVMNVHNEELMNNSRKTSSSSTKNEPKGWKKASDKKRDVELEGHECSICLEDIEGGDISYCEQVSCNEPYHNDCLDEYWSKGFRNCPRCRKPMPPRDAYPALA